MQYERTHLPRPIVLLLLLVLGSRSMHRGWWVAWCVRWWVGGIGRFVRKGPSTLQCTDGASLCTIIIAASARVSYSCNTTGMISYLVPSYGSRAGRVMSASAATRTLEPWLMGNAVEGIGKNVAVRNLRQPGSGQPGLDERERLCTMQRRWEPEKASMRRSGPGPCVLCIWMRYNKGKRQSPEGDHRESDSWTCRMVVSHISSSHIRHQRNMIGFRM